MAVHPRPAFINFMSSWGSPSGKSKRVWSGSVFRDTRERGHSRIESRAKSTGTGTTLTTAPDGTSRLSQTSEASARCSVPRVARFVVDCRTLLGIAAGEIEVAAAHQLVAPTLVRSQALSALYEASRRGEISAAEGLERVTRINSLKVRFLGDKVLQRQAWKVADQLGWKTTYDAEYVALTKLQADALVTSDSDLARAVSGLVATAGLDALQSA